VTPVPCNGIVKFELFAFDVIVREPFLFPAEGGVKIALKVAL